MRFTPVIRFVLIFLSLGAVQACSTTSYPWPDAETVSPKIVSSKDILSPDDLSQLTRDEVMAVISGRYAHYDVVAYEDIEADPVMRTFVISYGFTEFFTDGDELIERDRFCSASHKMSFKTVRSSFSDAATQAIIPADKAVELSLKNGQWQIIREPTPTLLGITGDPNLPLSRNKNDPNLVDADGDGKPGVSVQIKIAGILKGKIYMTRREIFKNIMTVENSDRITGHVIDSSEQFVLGASLKMLAKPSDPVQHPDPAMNPIILVRVGDDIQSCEQLMDNRDNLFPPEPEFF